MDDTTEFCYNLLKPNGRIKEICQDEPIIDESTIANDGFVVPDDPSFEWYIDGDPINGDPQVTVDWSTNPWYPVEVIDKPWYQDIWDTVTGLSDHPWLQNLAIGVAVIVIASFI